MPVSRMRMRPWLETKIDSNAFPGLRWLNKERTLFSISWKHAARHGWEITKDASLFKEWAIHTGKYVEGQVSDPKTWKANFRCAMNSLPDIEEVKDQSINKGHGAVRVFKMLPVTQKSRDRRNRAAKQRRHATVKVKEDSCDSDSVPSPTQTHVPSPQDCRVDSSMDSTVKREQPDLTYMMNDEVPQWSSLGFDFSRKFEVSPAHSFSTEDDAIIEICAEWERERSWTSSQSSNVFLNNEGQCSSPGSMYSEASSADELEEIRYTNLLPSPFYSLTYPLSCWCRGVTFLDNNDYFTDNLKRASTSKTPLPFGSFPANCDDDFETKGNDKILHLSSSSDCFFFALKSMCSFNVAYLFYTGYIVYSCHVCPKTYLKLWFLCQFWMILKLVHCSFLKKKKEQRDVISISVLKICLYSNWKKHKGQIWNINEITVFIYSID